MPAFIGWIVAKIFTDGLLKFAASKILITGLFVIVLPIILNNFLYDLIEILMTSMNKALGDTSAINGSINLDGLGAWFVSVTKIPECLSVIMGAYLMRISIRHIPFLRV